VFNTLGREELWRSIECLIESFEDLFVNSLYGIVVVGLGLLCQLRGCFIAVGRFLLLREAFRDVHNNSVAVGVVTKGLSSVDEVVDIVAISGGAFAGGRLVGGVLLQAAEHTAVCVVVVAHGCVLACRVASGALDG